MKITFKFAGVCVLLVSLSQPGFAQGTAFTYQGRLNDGGNPANGSYDLAFSLYTVSSGGAVAQGPLTNSATPVINGLFTVTLDFGSNVFNGAAYWLDISARTHGNGAFTELSPRQPLTASPYSVYSGQAAYSTVADGVAGGTIGPNAFAVGAGPTAGQVLSYNGSGLAWANPGGGGGSFWSLTGNSGTVPGTDFLGTLDNEPLELWVNNARALRLAPDQTGLGVGPNVIGGASNNSIDSTVGASVIGGGHNNAIATYALDGTIGGGTLNTIASSASSATIGGGNNNTVSNLYPTIAGGQNNNSLANAATIGGGNANMAGGRASTIAGGDRNTASGDGAFVGGGGYDGTAESGNTASGAASTVGGGIGNSASSYYATVAGGYTNTASDIYTFVGGGTGNNASHEAATVGGGFINTASGLASTVPGGAQNVAQGSYSFASGHYARAFHDGSFVWADDQGTPFDSTANNQFGVRAFGGVRFVTGGAGMTIDGVPVSGGGGGGSGWSLTGNAGTDPSVNFLGTTDGAALSLRVNNAQALLLIPDTGGGADLIGGSHNSVAPGSTAATISGGLQNYIGATAATIAGGVMNTNTGEYATVGGGWQNTAGYLATVSGGWGNTAGGNYGTVSGGWDNTAGAYYATVPGGFGNSAMGQGSFAAGQNASTTYPGSFIWGDGSRAATGGGANHFDVLATGGVNFFVGGGTPTLSAVPISGQTLVGINTSTPRQPLDVNGGFLEVQGNDAQVAVGGFSAGAVLVGSFNPVVQKVIFENISNLTAMSIECCSVIIDGGCDLAEPFPFSAAEQEIPQGAVVVIDDANPGRLKMSDQRYDTRVAGIVSGANGINPGIQMHQEGVLEGGKNVALTGRVYVQADTSNGAIKPGDLLTTSGLPGHAMRVSDHAKAQGAILGKAMTGLSDGNGMVLVLVSLQ